MEPWLIVGLGNPGGRYQGTRHNVGFGVVERLSSLGGRRLRRPHLFGLLGRYRFARLGPPELFVAQPLTYMNRSGDVVPDLLSRSGVPLERLLLVTDNLDLPPGATRLKKQGSAGSHNGLKSVSATLGSDAYARLYLGIGHPGSPDKVVDHVLGAPEGEESEAIGEAVERAAETLLQLPRIGLEQAINELNRKR